MRSEPTRVSKLILGSLARFLNAARSSASSASAWRTASLTISDIVCELEAIDRKADRQRIVRAIQALAENPRAAGCEKLAGAEDRCRVRVGSYRVVYAIRDLKRVVDIVKIGHRREVYR